MFSRNSRFLILAFAGLALAFAAASRAYEHTVKPLVHVAAAWLKDHALLACKLAGGEDEVAAKPAVLLVQAKAFVLRLAKRERPTLTSRWRMCPST